MTEPLFYGAATALVTPFRGKRIDFDALERLIDRQIDGGIDALVALGTTGEPASVTPPERSAIIECAAARVGRRVPLIVGVGSNDTRAAVALAREAEQLGADALLAVTPYYNKTSERGLIEHFNAVADSVELPVILYDVPSRTGMTLPPRVVEELARHPNLCAVKEASGDLRQLTELAERCGGGVAIYSGCDDLVLPALALGARGVISVAGNLAPRAMHELVSQWLRGDVKRSRDIQLEYLPLARALSHPVNPIPVKAALAMMGLCEETLRLPLVPLDIDEREALARVLKRYGLVEG